MRVVVLGAGYAGLTLARELEDRLPATVDLTVVDERETHLVQHLIHRLVRKPDLAETLQIPLASQFEAAEHRRARVTEVDPAAGRIELEDGEDLPYDVGAVCLGARPDYVGVEGIRRHGTPLKRPEHAERIREEFLDVLAAGGRVVIGGAGLSGVQVAGELATLGRERGAEQDGSGSRPPEIVLLERMGSVAPEFPRKFREGVAAALADAGVDVRTGSTVTDATDDAVVLADGTELDYDQFVWTGGIAGPEALDSRRPRVRATLRLGADTLGVGDAVRVVDREGSAVPASAQTAIGQAKVAARNVERLLEAKRRRDGGFEPRLDQYRYRSRGWLVSVGDDAVAQVGPTVVRGRPAKALKATVGLGYLGTTDRIDRALSLLES